MLRIFVILVCLFSCVPVDGPNKQDNQEVVYNEDCESCELLLYNFASSNYSNRDFNSAVENYSQAVKCGCGKKYAEDIYNWWGRSYMELSLYDKANSVFRQGLKYLPEDIDLLKIAAHNAHKKLNKLDLSLFYYDEILAINDCDLKTLSNLSELYLKFNMSEDQIKVLDKWLSCSPNNEDALAQKKEAYLQSGKDPINIYKETWEIDESNISNGLDYISALKEEGSYEQIIEVASRLLSYSKYEKDVLLDKAEAQLELYLQVEALETYIIIHKVDPVNAFVCIEISKIEKDLANYKSALDWAEKAISLSNNSEQAYSNRASVYYSIADDCTEDQLKFSDKLVYEMAYEDYQKVATIGNDKGASNKVNFLESNELITSSSDWFMIGGNEGELSPTGKCYEWISRKIKRK